MLKKCLIYFFMKYLIVLKKNQSLVTNVGQTYASFISYNNSIKKLFVQEKKANYNNNK